MRWKGDNERDIDDVCNQFIWLSIGVAIIISILEFLTVILR